VGSWTGSTCFYDIVERLKLNLRERPLVVIGGDGCERVRVHGMFPMEKTVLRFSIV
jgi:hypothetical protein